MINRKEIWNKKLELVKEYINENGKLPTPNNKHKEIKSLGKWISHNKQNYKKPKSKEHSKNISESLKGKKKTKNKCFY